jgi:hypothetical protein
MQREFVMSKPPRNWIDPSSAFIVKIAPEGDGDEKAIAVPSALLNAAAHVASPATTPPWQCEKLVSFFESQTGRQCVVLTKTASAFATAVAIMGLENGFDTFLVASDFDATSQDLIGRLQQTGARLYSLARFVEECALVFPH